MAVGLAELFPRLGLPVVFLPTEVRLTKPDEESVHHRWDHLAATNCNLTAEEWLPRVSHVVWFDIQPRKLEAARRAGKKNILVLLWHRLAAEDLPFLSWFDRIVCPSRACAAWLRGIQPLVSAACIPWDGGLPLAARLHSPFHPQERRLLVYLDGPSADACATGVLGVIFALLRADSRVKVAICRAASWPRDAKPLARGLLADYPQRFMDMLRMCFLERADACRVHDWVWCPACKDNAGAHLLEGLSHGRPVIGFDALPASEIVTDGLNGRLVPCRVNCNAMGAPLVVFDQAQAQQAVFDALLGASFVAVQQHEWTDLEQRKRNFQDAWKRLLLSEDDMEQ